MWNSCSGLAFACHDPQEFGLRMSQLIDAATSRILWTWQTDAHAVL